MTNQMLQDYIELLEEQDFLDARHVKYLAMAKEELAQKAEEGLLDLDKVDYEFALENN